MRRKPKKEGIYVHIELIHTAIQKKLPQHCTATILPIKISKKETKVNTDLVSRSF